MKLTKLLKLILNNLPGYRERISKSKTQQLIDAKAQLLKAAEPRLRFNARLQQPEYVYSQGVQTVLSFYEQEVRRLELSLKGLRSPGKPYPAAAITHRN